MKIALDLRRIKNPGIGRYMRCLTEAMLAVAPEHEYLLILPPDSLDAIRTGQGAVEKVACPAAYYSIREQMDIPRILRRHQVDLLHAPHFNVPLMPPCPTVVTIHDVIYLACPEDLPSLVGRCYYRAMMTAVVRLTDRIITDSEFSKTEIARFLKTDRDIEVIHPGIDSGFQPVVDAARVRDVKARRRIRGDYVLYTGIYKRRKNHAGLLRAFRRFVELGGDAILVIAGPVDEGEAELRSILREMNLAHRVIITGFVNDCDLPALYSGARVYACPSLYEGFGFTVLEAMACGVPVVCSVETSLPEVGGEATLYADARNARDFGDALYRAFTDDDLRRTLVKKGFTNVARFQWHEAALKTLAVYRRTLGDKAAKMAYA